MSLRCPRHFRGWTGTRGVGGPGLLGSLWRYRLVDRGRDSARCHRGVCRLPSLPAKYEAEASLFLRDPGSPAVITLGGFPFQSGDHAVFMATQAELAGSDVVYERALKNLKRSGTPDDVRRSVVVKPSADLTSITIRATSGDPAESANLATAVGNAYEQVTGERIAADAKVAITGLQEMRAKREAEFDALRVQIAQTSGPDLVTLMDSARATGDRIGELQVHEQEIAAQAAVYGSGVESFQEAVLANFVVAALRAAAGGLRCGTRVGRCRRLGLVGSRAEPPRGTCDAPANGWRSPTPRCSAICSTADSRSVPTPGAAAPAGARPPAACCAAGAQENVHNRRGSVDLRRG